MVTKAEIRRFEKKLAKRRQERNALIDKLFSSGEVNNLEEAMEAGLSYVEAVYGMTKWKT